MAQNSLEPAILSEPEMKEKDLVTIQADNARTAQDPEEQRLSSTVTAVDEVHSVYSNAVKKAIVVMAMIASFISPLSTAIYLPVLNALARDLKVTSSQINLTVTTYLIFQGISPSILVGFSDFAGRKPAFLLCFILFIASNVGLALQSSYAALLVLRALQSAGSSGTIPLLSGVIADVATSAERGSYQGFASVSIVLGPTLSPVLGGILGQYLGWRSIFWCLLIYTAPVVVIMALFFPETAQRVVGNGLYRPPRFLNRSLTYEYLRRRREAEHITVDQERQAKLLSQFKFKIPNPVESVRIIFTKGPGLLMFFNGLIISIHYLTLSSMPFIFQKVFQFKELYISLMYLPYGGGSVVSSFTTGKLIDWNYRRYATRHGFSLEKRKQIDLTHFPIERARLELVFPILCFCCAMLILYGWTLTISGVSVAAPAVISFGIGWSLFAIFQITSVLVIDIYPESPATATATNNIVRCLLGAGATAFVIPLISRLGTGWAFTVTAAIPFFFSPICFLLMRKGPQWRQKLKTNTEKDKEEATTENITTGKKI